MTRGLIRTTTLTLLLPCLGACDGSSPSDGATDNAGQGAASGAAGMTAGTGGSSGDTSGSSGVSGDSGASGQQGGAGVGSAGQPPLAGTAGTSGSGGGVPADDDAADDTLADDDGLADDGDDDSAGDDDTGSSSDDDAADDTTADDDGAVSTADCTFSIEAQTSDVIPSVGIVEWSIDGKTVDSAYVQFGLDTSYGKTAPVDLQEPGFRTTVLGMKVSKEYHLSIVAEVGGETCVSQDFTLTTGDIPNGLMSMPDVLTPLPDEVADGYFVAGRWGDGNDGPSFILDEDRDLVWWYPVPGDVIRTRMTVDGKGMWMRNTGQAQGTGTVLRVSMDGLREERWDLGMTTHDLAVLPDGNVALTQWDGMGCAEIVEFNPETEELKTVFHASDAHGSGSCHVNNLQYYAEDDTYTFSDYTQDCYVKITRSGELVWVLNGPASDFTGTNWSRQHGLHILSEDHLLVFSNEGENRSSMVYELMLNRDDMTVETLWDYDAGISATFGGDVQRLENGNTLITYSSAGVVQELNKDGQLVQELSWPLNNAVSYSVHRPTLYGPPTARLWKFEESP